VHDGLALTLCGLAAIGLLAVGVLALLSPQRLARSYGVPARELSTLAYVRAAGVRDVILGLLFVTNVYLKDAFDLLILCVAGLILSLADFAIAFTAAGRKLHSEHGGHIGGAIGFAILIALLLRP